MHRGFGFLISILALSVALPLPAEAAPKHRKSPGEIAETSRLITERNESCRRQANDLKLRLMKRYRYIRDCKKR